MAAAARRLVGFHRASAFARIRTASAPNQANHSDEPHDQLSLTRNASALSRIFILPISTGILTYAPGAGVLHSPPMAERVNVDRDTASSLLRHVRCTPGQRQ